MYLALTVIQIGEGNGTPLQYFCLENPMDGGAWWAAVHGVARVGHDWATSLSLFTFMHWRRKWQPIPVFLPGESQGQEAWLAAVYGVAQSWTWLKRRSSSSSSDPDWSFPGGSVGKESTCNVGDTRDVGLIPGLGRSPGGGHGNSLQYSCLENPMDRGAWWVTVHRVTKSWTWQKPTEHKLMWSRLRELLLCLLSSDFHNNSVRWSVSSLVFTMLKSSHRKTTNKNAITKPTIHWVFICQALF